MSSLANLASTISNRFTTNISQSISSLSAQQWIRLVAIIGAYLLLRPYILKHAAKVQMDRHEKEEAEAEAAADATKLSANDFRGHKIAIPADSDDEEGEDKGAASGAADWGKKARRRQRDMVRKLLAEHERRLAEEQEDEEDKDIEEFLVD